MSSYTQKQLATKYKLIFYDFFFFLSRNYSLKPNKKSKRYGFNIIDPSTSLVVHWLRLQAPSAGGQGSTLAQGTRSHMLQPASVCMSLEILHGTTKI